MKWIKNNVLNIVLSAFLLFGIAYLLCPDLREVIENSKYDAGLISGLVAALALIYSIKQGVELKMQNVRNMNFAYRLSVKSKFEDMGQAVIAKLYNIDARRHACVATLQGIKQCLGTETEYRDGFNITSTDAFNSDSCQATAAMDVYFPEQAKKWNGVIDTLNKMGSLASTAMMTYVENDCGRKTTNFLSNIDAHIQTMKDLDQKMAEKPKEIRDGVIEKVNEHTLNVGKV